MTMPSSERITCSECKNTFETRFYNSVNVTLDPSLKDAILSRSLNNAFCPQCKAQVTIASGLLYHDMHNKLWLQTIWEDEQKWAEAETRYKDALKSTATEYRGLAPAFASIEKEMTVRLVFGYNQLREKVLIFDAKLDDRIIEFLKIVALSEYGPLHKLLDNEVAMEILFEGIEDGKISFVCLPDGSDLLSFALKRELYNNIVNDPGAKQDAFDDFKDALYVNFNRLLMEWEGAVLKQQASLRKSGG